MNEDQALHERRLRLLDYLMSLLGKFKHYEEIRLTIEFEASADGGMGGFCVVGADTMRGHVVKEVEYIDSDDLLVYIALFTDDNLCPTEVEFAKVSFGPLIDFPSPNQIRPTE